jgi:hypothetical protein
MKVGKAIYNILSRSTDVQSNFPFNTTDYAPTGTELVTNGDFSAAGSNLVSNPNFTDGVEKIVDGDFPFPNVNWNLNTGVTVPSAGILDFDGTGGAYASQDILTSGKSYKVSIAVATTSLDTLNVFLGGGNSIYSSVVAADTTIVIYGVSGGSNDLLYIGDWEGTITSVSVKELGADWTDSGTPLNAATFDANGLTITSVNGDGNNNRVSQANVTDDAKSYKVTYTIHSVTLTGTNVFQYYNGSTYVTFSEQGVGTHTFYFTRQSTDDNWYFRLETSNGSTTDYVTISSVSVQELGEGWTLQAGGGWSIGDAKAIADGSESSLNFLSQDLGLVTIKNYKISFNSDRVGGVLFVRDSDDTTLYTLNAGTGLAVNTFYNTWAGSGGTLKFYAYNYNGSITNITVQEMILTKIFPELAPPDIDAPYVVYSVVSNSPSETKNANGDIDTANVEVYGFQDTYNKAVDLGVSVRAALDRKTGTYNTIEIQSTNYVGEQMDVNEARKLWAAIQDYSIRIKNI